MQRTGKVGMGLAGLAGMAGAGWAMRQAMREASAANESRLRRIGSRINVDRWGATGRKRKP